MNPNNADKRGEPGAWTEELVRTHLPQIRVKIGNRAPCWARVIGRLNPVATVIPDCSTNLRIEVPWDILVDHLNKRESTGKLVWIEFEEKIELKRFPHEKE